MFSIYPLYLHHFQHRVLCWCAGDSVFLSIIFLHVFDKDSSKNTVSCENSVNDVFTKVVTKGSFAKVVLGWAFSTNVHIKLHISSTHLKWSSYGMKYTHTRARARACTHAHTNKYIYTYLIVLKGGSWKKQGRLCCFNNLTAFKF